MSDFTVDDKKISYISGQFHVEKEYVERAYKMFLSVIDGLKNQYLAHIIRCMEVYIRKETKNPMFQINTFPITSDPPVLNVGCAQYYPKRYFSVFFDPRMEEKQLRVCLSHELGHLFIIELLNNKRTDNSASLDEKTLTEPLSSIFGVFTMMDKNHFYMESAQKLNHISFKELIEDFIHLQKRIVN